MQPNWQPAAGAQPGSQLAAFLKLLRGEKPDRVVWTADITYWMDGQRQAGTASPSWNGEEGLLEFHSELGILPYYDYSQFWAAEVEYDSSVRVSECTQEQSTVTTIHTSLGTLTQETRYLPESCCTGCVRHYVNSDADLDVLRYVLEHRHWRPAHLNDYPSRAKLWERYDGLPSLALPRSPLASFTCEWCGLETLVYLLMDCPEKIRPLLKLMSEQEAPVLQAVCALAPPMVHFADNLDSESLAGLYDRYMAEDHRRRIAQLHQAGIRCAVHLDGAVRGLLPKLVAAGFDAVEAVTPKPAGDLDVREMHELAGENVILWGGVPGVMFAPPYTWEDMQRHVREVLHCWRDRPFVLGVADQVPPNGRIEFCRRIADLVEESRC